MHCTDIAMHSMAMLLVGWCWLVGWSCGCTVEKRLDETSCHLGYPPTTPRVHEAPGPRGPGSKTRSSQKPDISSPAKC